MEENIYSPPLATVADVPVAVEARKFYAVSTPKFWVLMIATFGMYRIYWFYKHWALYKRRTGTPMWPVMRTLFPIFFVHALYEEIDAEITRNGERHEWLWRTAAGFYIVGTVAENIASRLGSMSVPEHITAWIQLIAALVVFWMGHIGQRAANAAVGDPDGQSNARFTIANWCWIVFGVLMWSLILIGLSLPPEALEG